MVQRVKVCAVRASRSESEPQNTLWKVRINFPGLSFDFNMHTHISYTHILNRFLIFN